MTPNEHSSRDEKVFPILVLIIAAALSLAGCGDRDGRDDAPTETTMVRVNSGSPRIFVDAWSFKGKFVNPRNLLVEKADGPVELEFLPLAEGEFDEEIRLDVFAVVDGDETLLRRCTPLFQKSSAIKGFKVFDALADRVRIDLSEYGGQEIAIKWFFHDDGDPVPGAVGNLTIGPKRRASDGLGADGMNVLFVCSDTHRYDFACGAEGQKLMPNVQSLAAESVVYHQASASATWTMPSIASTLTGLHPRYHRTGFRTGTIDYEEFDADTIPDDQFGFKLGDKVRLLSVYPKQLKTVTESLQEGGYFTAMIASNPLYILSGLSADGQDVVVKSGVVSGEKVTNIALGLIDSRPEDRPFFLLAHYMDVHQWNPWYFKKRYPDLVPAENRDELIAAYSDGVRDTDAAVGRLLEGWKEKIGMAKSMVVFYSDHGEHLLDPGRSITGHGNSQDESLLHVPLIVRYPDAAAIDPGNVDLPVSLLDLPATVLDLAGLAPQGELFHGRPLPRPGAAQAAGERLLFADSQLYGDEMSSVRSGRFKLVLNFESKTKELFDLEAATATAAESGLLVIDDDLAKKLHGAYNDYCRRAEEKTGHLRAERSVDQAEAARGMDSLGYTR